MNDGSIRSAPVPEPGDAGTLCGLCDPTAALRHARSVPGERDRYPNFFVIGATKAGTTSLHSYLGQHPEIYMPSFKELGFFQIDAEFARGLSSLVRHHYRKADRFPARGDGTPTYLYNSFVAERIAATLPATSHRFVVLLRDPVRRAYSAYLHMVRLGLEQETFDRALDLEAERVRSDVHRSYSWGYVTAGRYAHFLAPWLDRFGRAALLPVVSEELRADPNAVMRTISEFLDVDPDFRFDTHQQLNAASEARFGLLSKLWSAPEPVKRTVNAAVPYRVRGRIQERLARLDAKPATHPPLDPSTAARLRSVLEPDIVELERLIGRPLSRWSDDG
jgi:Sulfotransferase family